MEVRVTGSAKRHIAIGISLSELRKMFGNFEGLRRQYKSFWNLKRRFELEEKYRKSVNSNGLSAKTLQWGRYSSHWRFIACKAKFGRGFSLTRKSVCVPPGATHKTLHPRARKTSPEYYFIQSPPSLLSDESDFAQSKPRRPMIIGDEESISINTPKRCK